MTDRKKAARKAARTRATNRENWRRWKEIEQPSITQTTALLNRLLNRGGPIYLHWKDRAGTGRKLKNGAEYGTLVRFTHGGRRWVVLPEGYKRHRPQRDSLRWRGTYLLRWQQRPQRAKKEMSWNV